MRMVTTTCDADQWHVFIPIQAMPLDRCSFKTVHETVFQSGLYPLGAVIGEIVFPQNPYFEGPTPNMTAIRDEAF